MKAADYYQNIQSKWQTEYPSSSDMDEVWAFYRECGYQDPQKTLRGLLAKIGWSKNRVLDLGCDRGLMLDFICQEYPQVAGYGLDINKSAIEAAQEKFPSYTFETFDGVSIPYPDKHFDSVFICAVVKHIRYQDRDHFYSELKRVADTALLIEVDSKEQKESSHKGWTFYHSHFEEEFKSYLTPIEVVHEAGDLLGLYSCA